MGARRALSCFQRELFSSILHVGIVSNICMYAYFNCSLSYKYDYVCMYVCMHELKLFFGILTTYVIGKDNSNMQMMYVFMCVYVCMYVFIYLCVSAIA